MCVEDDNYRSRMVRNLSSTLRDFPVEITEPISALNDKKRREILLLLLEMESLSYSEIRSALGIGKGTLNHHLNILVGSGLVQNFSIKIPSSPYTSYYRVTNFGDRFLRGLRQALEPKGYEIITLIDNANSSATREIDHETPIAMGASESGESEQPRCSRTYNMIVKKVK